MEILLVLIGLIGLAFGAVLVGANIYAAIKVFDDYLKKGNALNGTIAALWIGLPVVILVIILILAASGHKNDLDLPDIIGHY